MAGFPPQQNIGIAFQIQDDYLDAFGNTSQTGKQEESEILENKKTVLLLKAFEVADSKQKKELLKAMEQTGTSRIHAVIDLYVMLKVDVWASNRILHYTETALKNLDGIDIPVYKKVKIMELATSLLTRQS